MSFTSDLTAFAEKVEGRQRQLFVGSVDAVHHSITEGSPISGAPGQPVDTGFLKSSWIEEFPEDWVGEISTNVVYAPPIEEGIGPHGPLTLRSAVGGFHSVKLTRAAWDRITQSEVAKL